MIGSLRGTLLDRGAAEVTLEVGGVGYRVVVSPTTVVALGEVGDEVFCWVHHHQREDAVTLYGFATRDERTCFEALLGAHGVGPALALAILSIHSPVALARILAEDDLGSLCLVPGVGKKTAARLLIDLKSRLSVPDLGDGPAGTAPARPVGAGAARADVRDALAGLGYSEAEIRQVMADLPDGRADLPDSTAGLPDGPAGSSGGNPDLPEGPGSDDDAGALLRDALARLAAARR